jgi:predicted SnoaL-like aldol condensation-catalyzing enzyme
MKRLLPRTGLLFVFLICSLLSSGQQKRNLAQEAKNKKFVADFFHILYNEKDLTRARSMMLPGFINHHPHGGNGADGTLNAMSEHLFKKYPDFSVEIKRIAAEGDLVWIQCYTKDNKEDHGKMSMDIWRIQEGKIAEHWDIIQEVPKDIDPSFMFN